MSDLSAGGAAEANPACPVCGQARGEHYAVARDIEYFTSPDPYSFLRCIDCDVLYISPMLHDRLGFIYPKNYYSFHVSKRNAAIAVKEWLDRRALSRISRSIPGEDLRALDVGGGVGWMLQLLKDGDPRFTRTTVVDIDNGAQEAAEEAGHEYLLGRFEDVDLGDRTFDLILMLNLIEHVPDPMGLLATARDRLSDRGYIWIKTPNFRALDARLFRHRSWGGYHTPRHFVLFTKESLSRRCEEVGLEVVSATYTQGAPFWGVSLLEELRRLGLARVDQARPAIYHPLMPFLQMAGAGIDFLRSPFAPLSQMFFLLRKSGSGPH